MFRLGLLLALVGFGYAADLAKYRQDGYYGKEDVRDGQSIPADNQEIRPFNVSIPESELSYLRERLANARFIDHLPDTRFHYGMSSEELKKVVNYWNSTYDWRKEEAKLNSYPQFKTQIEGIDIHYLHANASSNARTVIPLITVHGWPSSYLEVYEALPMLTEPDENGVAFEVIAPSIPGYGYSEAAHKKGMDYTAAARIFAKLMKRIGHEKYMLQGGDWGGFITRAMAILYPENAMGIHVLGLFDALDNLLSMKRLARNLLYPHIPDLNPEHIKRDYKKLFPLKQTLKDAFEETGVMHQQATKPDTLAAALVDSPVGLAAHILEKFSGYTNKAYRDLKDGGLTKKFTMDQLLTNVMIYWTSPNVAGTTRIYKEMIEENTGVNSEKVYVPAGVVDAEYEMIRSPKIIVEANYARLLQYTDLRTGGHFMFFEEPKMIVDDLRAFTQKLLNPEEHQGLIDKVKDKLKDKLLPKF